MHGVISFAPAPGGDRGSNAIPTDEALIGSITRRDEQAMKLLFKRHNVRVFRFIVRLTGARELAEDVVSEVFLDVWRSAGTFEGRCRVSTWLLSIARNKALATLRKRRPEPLDSEFAEAIPDPGEGPEAAADTAQRSAILRRCLADLPRSDRELLDLAYYHERTAAEIAGIVGAPIGTVKSRLFNARRRVAELFAQAETPEQRRDIGAAPGSPGD
jgi:RNA polymerase sigma-70 factor (ECF subfamily)